LGKTKGKILINANGFSARTIAHEVGHTLGLSDNFKDHLSPGGLMDYPAGPLSTKDVDNIIKHAYVKNK